MCRLALLRENVVIALVLLRHLSRNSIRNLNTLENRHTVGNLTQHLGHRNVQSLANPCQQFGGSFLLTALNFAQVTEGNTGTLGNLTQGAALTLANVAKDLTDCLSQGNNLGFLNDRGGLSGGLLDFLPLSNAINRYALLSHELLYHFPE
ncbi:hypothetical protein RMDY18_14550 [Rothia mucilaginosa DY-18]|uniref:Uncharacterized protein n=1 Tax=Rothia mucilaginosa (strain DY-18) TaxID=680646 RepID=D2NNR9_ROTMD|nr:hypothetical protein RMDY18_14550 [Rothia mucilaginosa DY-18]